MRDRAFAANELYRVIQGKHAVQQATHDLLGYDVIDADREPHGSMRGTLSERAQQVAAELEDLIRIGEYEASRFRRHERAARLHEQLLPDALFERAQLRADGRSGQVQFLAGLTQAAGAHDGPEV